MTIREFTATRHSPHLVRSLLPRDVRYARVRLTKVGTARLQQRVERLAVVPAKQAHDFAQELGAVLRVLLQRLQAL